MAVHIICPNFSYQHIYSIKTGNVDNKLKMPYALQTNLVLALRHYKRKQDIITVIIKIASYYPVNSEFVLYYSQSASKHLTCHSINTSLYSVESEGCAAYFDEVYCKMRVVSVS